MADILGKLLLGAVSVALAVGCDSAMLSEPEDGGAAGNGTSNAAAAGSLSAGGKGNVSTGGAMLAIGGQTPTGGSPGAGGLMPTGGSPGAGGTWVLGGSPGAGGTWVLGGSPGAGGTWVLGGSPGTGGGPSNVAGTGAVGTSVNVHHCGNTATYPCYGCDPLPAGSKGGCPPVRGCSSAADSSSSVRYPDGCFVVLYDMNPWYPDAHQTATCNANAPGYQWACQL